MSATGGPSIAVGSAVVIPARGDADERSDFDIAIDAPRLSRGEWVDIFHAAEDAETLLQIQIVDLRETDHKFRSRIESEGVVLYEREKE